MLFRCLQASFFYWYENCTNNITIENEKLSEKKGICQGFYFGVKGFAALFNSKTAVSLIVRGKYGPNCYDTIDRR